MSEVLAPTWRRAWFAAMLFFLAACAARPAAPPLTHDRAVTAPAPPPQGDALYVIGSFSGEQQERMIALLERFTSETGIRALYRGDGEVAELLRHSVEAAETPDIIFLPKAHWLGELASAGAIVPLAPEVAEAVTASFSTAWQSTVTYDETLYGVPFDANLKSLLWSQGAERADTAVSLDALIQEAENDAVRFTVTGGATWTLTDWFENVLLATSGTAVYDALATHDLAWTDPRVVAAARSYVALLAPEHILGGASGVDLPLDENSFRRTFSGGEPGANLWLGQGSIVIPYATTTGIDMPLPRPFPTGGTLIVVGSVAVATNERPETTRLMRYLTRAEAVAPWVGAGGFISPNLSVTAGAYPLPANALEAEYLTDAPALRTDLSDRLPPHLGAFLGEQLREMLRRPGEVERILSQVEQIATREMGSVPE